MKERLISAPVLGLPRDDGLFVLDTDASEVTTGVVQSQVQDGVERVIAYYGRLYVPAEIIYCTTRKELLAVVEGLRQFRPDVLGRHCVVRTDHAALPGRSTG